MPNCDSPTRAEPTPVWCLPVAQPWASLIAHGLKTAKVSDKPTRYRGRILIYAAKIVTKVTPLALADDDIREGLTLAGLKPDPWTEYGFHPDTPRGAVVGSVRVSGCYRSSRAPAAVTSAQRVWRPAPRAATLAQEKYGDLLPGNYLWTFSEPKALKTPVPLRCMPSLFRVRPELVTHALLAALAAPGIVLHRKPGEDRRELPFPPPPPQPEPPPQASPGSTSSGPTGPATGATRPGSGSAPTPGSRTRCSASPAGPTLFDGLTAG